MDEGKRSSRCDPRSPTGPRPSPPRGETESPAARGIRAKRLGVLRRLLHGHRRGGRAWPPPPPRAPPALTPHPVGLSPPHPPTRCGLLAPSGHPTSPPPPAILAIRVPSRSFLTVLTHTWGRTHRDRSGRSPRVPPLVESESIRVTDGLNRPSWIHRSRFPGFGAGRRMCRPQGQKPSGFPGAQIGSRDR